MSDPSLGQSEPIKDAINLALDSLESAAMGLADLMAGQRIDLTDRLGSLSGELEQLKANVWEALDA